MNCRHTLSDIATANHYGELCPLCLLAQVKRLDTALRVIRDMPAAAGGPKDTVVMMRAAARAALRPAPTYQETHTA